MIVDALQYCNWSEKIFRQMNAGGIAAVHVTVCYHEDFAETVENLIAWNQRFEMYSDLIVPGRCGADARLAHSEGRTAVYLGFQNCSPIEDNIGLVEIFHQLGARFMQLSYNNQSLLASGCYEAEDPGISRMGRQVISEMNRVGMVIDMSHSAERSTLEAIELSDRPIAITHANPAFWQPALRNKPDNVLTALSESGGMLGLSLYPHHLKDGSHCRLESFCDMVARLADMIGIDHIGFGSDLCQDQPDEVVAWMRNGTWTRDTDYGEGSSSAPGFPDQPTWFQDNQDFINILKGLNDIGFSEDEVKRIAGENWLDFFDQSFGANEVKL